MRTAFRIAVLGLVCALAVPAQTRAGDTVLVWNEIAVNTAIANGQNPFVQARTNAVARLYMAIEASDAGEKKTLPSHRPAATPPALASR